MISAAEFRIPVTFQRKQRVSDGAGGFTETWLAIPDAPIRAKVEALSGNERLEAARINASTRQRLTCRFFAGLTEADRVVIRGRAYNVTFIDDVLLRGHWYVIDLSGGGAT